MLVLALAMHGSKKKAAGEGVSHHASSRVCLRSPLAPPLMPWLIMTARPAHALYTAHTELAFFSPVLSQATAAYAAHTHPSSQHHTQGRSPVALRRLFFAAAAEASP